MKKILSILLIAGALAFGALSYHFILFDEGIVETNAWNHPGNSTHGSTIVWNAPTTRSSLFDIGNNRAKTSR